MPVHKWSNSSILSGLRVLKTSQVFSVEFESHSSGQITEERLFCFKPTFSGDCNGGHSLVQLGFNGSLVVKHSMMMYGI